MRLLAVSNNFSAKDKQNSLSNGLSLNSSLRQCSQYTDFLDADQLMHNQRCGL